MSLNLVVQPIVDAKGNIKDQVSEYKPSDKTKARFADLRREFERAERIKNKPYEEFNDRSLIEYQNKCQRNFNVYIPPKSLDPDLMWRAQTKNSLTRNKVISIAAHVTASILYPDITAQNENSEEDRDAAMVMKDLMEYSLEQSKYAQTFLNAVIGMLVNPAAIIFDGYAEITRKVKEITGKDTWETKEVLDEVFSGFQNMIVPIDEFFIGNIYESNVQKQPFIIRRKVIDYSSAKIKYGHIEDFKFVSPGLRHFYEPSQDTFYEQYDENMEEYLVEEVTYYNRLADLELRELNGVMMDNPDRPLQRKDKMYPFAVNGYERFDEGSFFYFKSLCDKLAPDQDVVDTMYNYIIDGTHLEVIKPYISFGDDIITSDVVRPGVITQLQGESKMQPVIDKIDLTSAVNTLKGVVEPVADASSQDPRSAGQQVKGGTTAFEVSRLEENARTQLGLFGKNIAQFVEDFGNLRLSTVLQHMTVGEAEKVMGDFANIKFNNILIADREEDGEKFSRRVEFDNELPETPEEEEELSFQLMKEEESKGNLRICKVDPKLFRERKYTAKVNPDFIGRKSEAVKKALNLEAYDRAIGNPLIAQNPQKLAQATKDFLLSNYKPGEEEKYIDLESPVSQINAPQPESSPVNAVARAEKATV